MKSQGQNNTGFTTVEVLITLFVGAILLGGGYQLYSIITKASIDTRNQTDASNIVYEQLRKYQSQISGPCSVNTIAITDDIPPDTTLSGELSMDLIRSCPFGSGQDISLLTVKLTYGEQGAQHEVSHALYAH